MGSPHVTFRRTLTVEEEPYFEQPFNSEPYKKRFFKAVGPRADDPTKEYETEVWDYGPGTHQMRRTSPMSSRCVHCGGMFLRQAEMCEELSAMILLAKSQQDV